MILIVLIILGLSFGSFVNALVWRTYKQETKSSRKKNKSSDLSIIKGRSVCVHCGHTLSAKDLVPVLSWLELRGRCRYCQKPISAQYPLVELLTTGLFIVSYHFWPMPFDMAGWLMFSLWLAATVLLVALAVYDLRWMILPNRLVFILIGVAFISIVLRLFSQPIIETLLAAVMGVVFSAGLFYLLFRVSDGKWIGGGDVKLAVALGLLVGGPLNAVLMLFLASLFGSLVAIPLLMAGKAKRSTHLPFGPFLIIATYIVFLFGETLSHWYEKIFLGI